MKAWIFCKVSESNLPFVELILHDLSISHHHIKGDLNLLVNEDGFQAISNTKYYNLIGRYQIPTNKKLVDKFTWTTDVAPRNIKNSEMTLPHYNIHVVTLYRSNKVLYAGLGEKLSKEFLNSLDPNTVDRVTIIYINHQNHRPLHTKFSSTTKYLRFYYDDQDLSKIAMRLKTSSPRVRNKLIKWLNKNRLPAYIDDDGIFVYDVEVAFSAYRLFRGLNGFGVKYELTEGPEYGYLLGLRRYAKVPAK